MTWLFALASTRMVLCASPADIAEHAVIAYSLLALGNAPWGVV